MTKVYHGHRGASGGRYTVQVQEQQEFRLLVHACKTHGAKDCQSPSGWDYGFGAFGGVELARWLLADCLGMAYLHHKELHYAFKSTFLNRLPPGDWTLSEAEIRSWADDRGVVGPTATDQDQELNP